ncbi:hypothetical protein ACOME3_008927 [Neoechinorhynchus agilis]
MIFLDPICAFDGFEGSNSKYSQKSDSSCHLLANYEERGESLSWKPRSQRRDPWFDHGPEQCWIDRLHADMVHNLAKWMMHALDADPASIGDLQRKEERVRYCGIELLRNARSFKQHPSSNVEQRLS